MKMKMKMKMKIDKTLIKCFCIFFAMGLLIAPLRSGMISIGPLTGFYLSSFVGFVLTYLLVLYFLSKKIAFG